MKEFSQKNFKYFWFTSLLWMSAGLFSSSHASIPNHPSLPPIQEMRGGKVSSPELEQGFAQLNQVEARYAESWEQQKRLTGATAKISRYTPPTQKRAKR